jgi:hypothetical protein
MSSNLRGIEFFLLFFSLFSNLLLVQFGILHLVCDNLLSACGKCPTSSSRTSLMALCSFLLLVVGVVGLRGARGDDWGDELKWL